MSITRTHGVYGASHWAAVSAALVEYLDYLLLTFREMKEVQVPLRAIHALQSLLSSALLATKDGPLQNPEASFNDYVIMREAIRKSVYTSEREEVRREIEAYSALLARLTEPHEMQDLPRELLVQARISFYNLQIQGESQSYDHRMRQAHPYNHLHDPARDN